MYFVSKMADLICGKKYIYIFKFCIRHIWKVPEVLELWSLVYAALTQTHFEATNCVLNMQEVNQTCKELAFHWLMRNTQVTGSTFFLNPEPFHLALGRVSRWTARSGGLKPDPDLWEWLCFLKATHHVSLCHTQRLVKVQKLCHWHTIRDFYLQ